MLSLIVTWRDRDELVRALPSMVVAAESVEGELVIVNFGGDAQRLDTQLEGFAGRVRVIAGPPQRYFHKAVANNIGAHFARYPLLFFCDCDIILPEGLVAKLVQRLDTSPGHFATLAGVRETETNSRGGRHVVSFGYQLDIKTADGRRLRIVDNEEDANDGTRQAPGLLLVRKDDFLRIDGYNGQLHGWGWEDQDMISRLTLGAGLTRINEGHALHISHDDDGRIAAYPPVSSRWESRDRMFRTALANYDDANFMGSFSVDTATHADFADSAMVDKVVA
ncbi:glycosyltransferase family 2 protein [Luteibacter sp. dw_328]|uniref:glycosyltransferase family 2 protein n=1 Tax=Luteibacter sp. dw_328 TaxID=2719796 RepID=UPI001BD3575F|nr:glycosyltransferase family 2 protein [Luteibacter sp. dw_328]